VALPPGALLLLHTDGLVDRAGAHGTDPLDLLPSAPPADPAALLAEVLAAADRAGPAGDDAAVMVVRLPSVP
jgi:serine/threonine protein phosphatase PrpC